jgi:GTPase SAR1 family protein
LNSWLNEIKNESSNACKILVGNKNDLEKDRKVTFEQGKEFANQNGMKFFETSVKENNNVKEIFLTIAKEIIQLNTNTKTNEKKEKNED